MQLYSTKKQSPDVNLQEAVFKGLPDDNGLFMPYQIPALPASFFQEIDQLSFQEIAFQVCQTLIGNEVPTAALRHIVEDAINFEAPVVHLHDNIHVLELFHGPTLAFKDFGARFMSRLMSHFLESASQDLHILVATSGDTGSAVAQGFLGVPNIKVTILYPSGKVSEIQEKQLTTIGQNITALEVDGTFDDCQRMVKQAFLDKELNAKHNLTSANSINISRLIPQSFYYFQAYAQLKMQGEPLVFCVPSGNFGNLCGGLIAYKMGLPVKKFIAATNINHIVPHYLETGEFTPKPSVATVANAMDVGNPSNFPRLQALFGNEYQEIVEQVEGTYFSDEEIKTTMGKVAQNSNYLLCPHSAIGYQALHNYFEKTGDQLQGVFLATAHPTKFLDIVQDATGKEVEIPERLQKVINQPKKSILMKNDFEELKAYLG